MSLASDFRVQAVLLLSMAAVLLGCSEAQEIPTASAEDDDVSAEVADSATDDAAESDLVEESSQAVIGASCTRDRDCSGAEWCNARGVCRADRAEGSACSRGSQCGSGRCESRKCAAAASSIEVDSVGPGVSASDRYSVAVVDGSARRDSFVYMSTPPTKLSGHRGDDGGDRWRNADASQSWTGLAAEGPVTVEVKRLRGAFTSVRLFPSSYGLTAEAVAADTARFTLPRPGMKVSVEFDGNSTDMLYIFADPIDDVAAPSGAGVYVPSAGTFALPSGSTAVSFGRGVHEIGYWKVPATVTRLHFARGAYVVGAIDARESTEMRVTGRGVLSGEAFPWRADGTNPTTSCGYDCWDKAVKMLSLARSGSVSVEGLTIANPPHYTISAGNDVATAAWTLDNFKIVGGWRWNNDGTAVPGGSTVRNCFVSANDDAMKLYNSNATIDGCVVRHLHNGSPFQLGWFTKSATNVVVRNVDIIRYDSNDLETPQGQGSDNHAVFNFATNGAHGGSGTISGFRFEDIRIENAPVRVFGLRAPRGQQIRDVLFMRVSVDGLGAGRNYLDAYSGGVLSGITFSSLSFGGTNVTAANRSIRAALDITGSATGVTFE